MSEKLDRDQTLALLKEVVAEQGEDYVYPAEWKASDPREFVPNPICMYVREGQPACIAGKVFAKAGLSLEFLTENEGLGAHEVAMDSCLFTSDAADLLVDVQTMQDNGVSWGEALRRVTANG